MRRLTVLAVLAFAAGSTLAHAEEPTTELTDPKLPNAPGPFHGYNVTGKYQGRYHSQISEFGLEPMVMLFTRETEFSAPLKDLLQQVNNAVEKYPAARLHPFLVVQSDDLPEVIGVDSDPAVASKDDDRRIELATKLQGQATALMIPHVDIVLAGKADLAKYKFDEDKIQFAFYLIQRDKITAQIRTTDKLDDDTVKKIMQALADKGRGTRK